MVQWYYNGTMILQWYHGITMVQWYTHSEVAGQPEVVSPPVCDPADSTFTTIQCVLVIESNVVFQSSAV